MAEKRQLTRVVFRRFKEGETIALFPYMPGNAHGNAVTSYMHTGQHAAADYAGVIAVTRPATGEECQELLAELTSVGYDNLHILRRQNPSLTHKLKDVESHVKIKASQKGNGVSL